MNRVLALQKFWRETIESIRKVLWNLFLISLGSVICAAAVNGIQIPHEFLSGGFVGTTLIIHHLVHSLPLAWLSIILLHSSTK